MAAVQNPAQPQQYCLRWNNHQHNLLSVFEDLLNHEAFVDVTIACDGLNLKAHKIVLSACSPYFQSMFYNTPDKHPVVFLKDVRYDEMKALLEFMYRGEVSVDQENLSSLLKVAEGLKIKGLADVSENHASAAVTAVSAAPRLPGLPLPPAHLVPHLHPSLLSPEGSIKRSLASSLSPSSFNLGPKRKRGRPRRLSGSEAVPLALSLGPEQELEAESRGRSESRAGASPLALDSSESEQSPIKSLKEGSRALSLSPGDSKVNDFHSEAESNDGRSSGLLMTHKESNRESITREATKDKDSPLEITSDGLVGNVSGSSSGSSSGSGWSGQAASSPSPGASHMAPPPPKSSPGLQSPSSHTGTRGNLASQPGAEAESLQDMSVRGLDLLKYAHIASDGSYRCIQCEKVQIVKSFKNKYSFQRHAFLYHEGNNRKVFPCPVCQKEFSRPDKMKQHLKQVHDCIIPKHESGSSTAQAPHPSHFLINPFLAPLDDPAAALDASKLGGLKDSGRDVFKLMSQIASHTANLKSPGGQGAS